MCMSSGFHEVYSHNLLLCFSIPVVLAISSALLLPIPSISVEYSNVIQSFNALIINVTASHLYRRVRLGAAYGISSTTDDSTNEMTSLSFRRTEGALGERSGAISEEDINGYHDTNADDFGQIPLEEFHSVTYAAEIVAI